VIRINGIPARRSFLIERRILEILCQDRQVKRSEVRSSGVAE
jgi:hypothetical protein